MYFWCHDISDLHSLVLLSYQDSRHPVHWRRYPFRFLKILEFCSALSLHIERKHTERQTTLAGNFSRKAKRATVHCGPRGDSGSPGHVAEGSVRDVGGLWQLWVALLAATACAATVEIQLIKYLRIVNTFMRHFRVFANINFQTWKINRKLNAKRMKRLRQPHSEAIRSDLYILYTIFVIHIF